MGDISNMPQRIKEPIMQAANATDAKANIEAEGDALIAVDRQDCRHGWRAEQAAMGRRLSRAEGGGVLQEAKFLQSPD